MDSIPFIVNFGGSKHTELMENDAIFPSFYLPPIQYVSLLARSKEAARIEKWEHFPKQTYRNRATISSHNGRLDLIIPVVKGSNVHTLMKDVRISYDFNWQRQHWMSLQTAYRSSSWFEFYEDDLAPFYEKRARFLFDYNEELLALLMKLLKVKTTLKCTTSYLKDGAGPDYRETIHPKKPAGFSTKPYFQLFESQNGFLPNLSVVDLLFSQGPQSPEFL